ncbi:MAG TPA: DUF2784 domain-containing protein [Mycobacterium sp.]|nr:DUF2784 domain-containing protein [Mycobacterium sp.]
MSSWRGSPPPWDSEDVYVAVVILAVSAHFAYLIYVASGGFLALRWRHTIWLHVPAVLWGVGVVVWHLACPLTWLEDWARAHAGMGSLPGSGFIGHYVAGVLYPSNDTGIAQALAFSAVLVSWVAYAVTAMRTSHRGPRADVARSALPRAQSRP